MTPNRDDATEKSLISVIDPAVYAADNTPPALNVIDFQCATLALAIGAGGITFTSANKIEFVLTHSDDGVTFTNVTDDDVIKDSFCPATITNGIIRSLTAAHAAATVQKLGYVGGKGYLKLLADFSGTHATGTPIAAVLIRECGIVIGAA